MNRVNVLIVAPNYDRSTAITGTWAADLEQRLARAGHGVKLLAGPAATAANLWKHLPQHDQLVFYGHAEHDKFLAQATGMVMLTPHDLLTVGDPPKLGGRPVYSACCFALSTLGSACGSATPTSEFVGYEVKFAVGARFPQEFGGVVNRWAERFVQNATARPVAWGLRADWKALADDFLVRNGRLSRQPNSFLGGYSATINALYVGGRP